MIAIEKIREGLDRLPNMISGGPGSQGPTEYVRRQDVLSMLGKLEEVTMELRPWRQSGLLIGTRTCGDIRVAMNGNMVDIWIRIDGRPVWFAVDAQELKDFLAQWDKDTWCRSHGNQAILRAESDGNAEEDMTGKPIDLRINPGYEKRGGEVSEEIGIPGALVEEMKDRYCKSLCGGYNYGEKRCDSYPRETWGTAQAQCGRLNDTVDFAIALTLKAVADGEVKIPGEEWRADFKGYIDREAAVIDGHLTNWEGDELRPICRLIALPLQEALGGEE